MPDAELLRIQVHLSLDAHPELFAVLVGLRPRRRAERVRQLALMGLTGLRVDARPAAALEAVPAPPPTPTEALPPARARLLQALHLAD